MLRHYYISKGWMVSRSARRIYQLAAGLSLALFFLLVGLQMLGKIPENVLPVLRLLVVAGVVGTATTLIAVEYFLFGFDDSPALKKVFWFCVMLLPLLGPALYCFIVYSRSKVLRDNDRLRTTAISA